MSSSNNDGGRTQRLLNTDRDDQSTGGGGLGDRSSKCPKTWKFAVTVLFVCALFLIGVVVGFYIAQTFEPYKSAQCRHSSSSSGWGAGGGSGVSGDGSSSTTGLDSDDDDPVKLSKLHESVVDLVPTEEAVLESVTVFTDYQVHSVSDLDHELVSQLQEHFNSCRFDDLSVEHYKTLISLPDPLRPSRLLAFNGITNETIVETDFKSLTFAGRLPGFVAYSPNASVEGELIYLNRGTLDDYSDKASKGLEGKIGLVRTGQTTLEEKVHLAECRGLIGLLVVEDSQELHRPLSRTQLCSDVTPYALFHVLPGGDPSTPSFPSIVGAWRPPLSEVKLPKIPVQTVSCETARLLLNSLDHGGTARSSEDLDTPVTVVQLEVNNQLLYKPIKNIIATLYGDKDSDFSILVGANRNSFDTGSSGGIPGTEVLMRASSAISRLFHKDHGQHWIPRRTIRFVSWGGSDFGYLGLTEFLEKYHDIWRNKLIAYIDLDSPSKGRKQLESGAGDHIAVTSSASLEVLINLIIKQLQNREGSSIPEHIWQSVARKPSANSHHSADVSPATLLRKHLPAPYVHLQVSEVSDDPESAPGESEGNYIVAQIASLLTLTLADSGVFHIQVHQTAHETISDVNKLINSFSGLIPNVTMGTFHVGLKRLRKSTMDFEDYIRRHLELERSEDVRMVNSALLQFEAEMTSIQVEVARIQAQHKTGRSQCVTVSDLCANSTNQEIQLMKDISALLSRVTAVPKVTDLAG